MFPVNKKCKTWLINKCLAPSKHYLHLYIDGQGPCNAETLVNNKLNLPWSRPWHSAQRWWGRRSSSWSPSCAGTSSDLDTTSYNYDYTRCSGSVTFWSGSGSGHLTNGSGSVTFWYGSGSGPLTNGFESVTLWYGSGNGPLTNGSGSGSRTCSFRQWTLKRRKQNDNFFSNFLLITF